MQPIMMLLKFPLTIQNGLRVLGHVVRTFTEKHWRTETAKADGTTRTVLH